MPYIPDGIEETKKMKKKIQENYFENIQMPL